MYSALQHLIWRSQRDRIQIVPRKISTLLTGNQTCALGRKSVERRTCPFAQSHDNNSKLRERERERERGKETGTITKS